MYCRIGHTERTPLSLDMEEDNAKTYFGANFFADVERRTHFFHFFLGSKWPRVLILLDCLLLDHSHYRTINPIDDVEYILEPRHRTLLT